MDNINWAKDMSSYSRQGDIKKQPKSTNTHKEKEVVTKSKEELLSMIDEVTTEFEKKYQQEPTPEVGNCLVNLQNIKLD
jgi:hypothetical protein